MKTSFAILFLFAITLSADTVITNSVQCQATGFPTTTGNTFCEAGLSSSNIAPPYPPPYGTASSSASVQYQTTASDPLTINILSSATSRDGIAWYHAQGLYLNYVLTVPGYASADTTVHVDLKTDGPVRQGIFKMEVTPIWQGGYGDTNVHAAFSLGNYHYTCGGSNAVNCDTPGILSTTPLTLTLGTVFSFDSDAHSSNSSIDGNQSSFAGLLLKFDFFEADGVTPVLAEQAAPIPEPRNMASAGIVGLLLLILAAKRKKVQQES